jgi:regulator of cell morphogenesis and NO signaling
MFGIHQLNHSQSNSSSFLSNELALLLNASPQTVVDWLTDAHHTFEHETIPRIEQDFLNLIRLFPNTPSLPVIFNLFLKFQMEMKLHMEIEEQKIYPVFLQQVTLESNREFNELMHSHEGSEPFLEEIIALLERSSFSENPFFQILLSRLKQFENDLRDHAWVEDHVLLLPY